MFGELVLVTGIDVQGANLEFVLFPLRDCCYTPALSIFWHVPESVDEFGYVTVGNSQVCIKSHVMSLFP